MREINMESFYKFKDYLVLEEGDIKIVFSTASNGRSFNRNTKEGLKELEGIKSEFDISNLAFIKQVHSDSIYNFNGEKDFNDLEGDAIITNKKDSAIGVFTADCVPILVINEERKVVAAIHSGWKGTFKSILRKTLEKMKNDFNVDNKNTKIFIGPHIRKCCYEVSEELKDKFLKEKNIDEKDLFDGRNLSMEKCIEKDAIDCKIDEKNIFTINKCTYCEEELKLHSYRKSDGAYGRLFSFVILK